MPTETKSIPSSPSVAVFLRGLFDYAGLFPPASLGMSQALLEYSTHQKEHDSWMTGPFVCPVSRLDELTGEKESFRKIVPIRLSLLPRTTSGSHLFGSSFREDIENIEQILEQHPDTFQVAMIEILVPMDTVELSASNDPTSNDPTSNNPALNNDPDCNEFDRWIVCLISDLEKMTNPPQRIFLEISRGSDYENSLKTAVRSISSLQSPKIAVGLKIRCGGKHQNDTPSSLEIAQFLQVVISGDQFFKATAGLHHPVRHCSDSTGMIMHGFLNVFFAAIFSAALKLDTDELIAVIESEDPSRFQFVDEGIRFDDYSVSTDSLKQIRTSQVLSIGSCSFDEPRDDLRSLNWLL